MALPDGRRFIIEAEPFEALMTDEEPDYSVWAPPGFFEAFEAGNRKRGLKAESAARPFIRLQFQDGVRSRVGVNGCQIEDVIDVLIERLEGFQTSILCCLENKYTIERLKEARMWQQERRRLRAEQGVEGTPYKHRS